MQVTWSDFSLLIDLVPSPLIQDRASCLLNRNNVVGPAGTRFVVFKSSAPSTPRKRSFISTVRPTVHTNPEKLLFENALQTGGIWETPTLRFSVDGKHFENGAFPKRWHYDNHMINPNPQGRTQAFPPPVIVGFSNFSGVVWTENISCVFRAKTPFSNSSGAVWTGPNGANWFTYSLLD